MRRIHIKPKENAYQYQIHSSPFCSTVYDDRTTLKNCPQKRIVDKSRNTDRKKTLGQTENIFTTRKKNTEQTDKKKKAITHITILEFDKFEIIKDKLNTYSACYKVIFSEICSEAINHYEKKVKHLIQ